MFKLKKNIKLFFLLLTAVVLSLGLLACQTEETFDKDATYSAITESCKLTKNYVDKSFLKDGIGEAKLTRIADGDTMSFRVDNQFITIRFYGIDTPESTGQVDKWGVSASLFVKGIINDTTQFVLESTTGGKPEKDSYGTRYLGYVWYRQTDSEDWKCLNILVVENGYSKNSVQNSPQYVYYPYFKEAENFAKEHKMHLWSEDEDPNYSTLALNVNIKELQENPDLYWNIDTQTGSKVRLEVLITDLKMGDTGTHTFTAVQIIDGEVYKYTVYTGYASSAASSYLKIGNSYDITGFIQEHNGQYQISGLVYVLGESGDGFVSRTEKESYIMFDSSIEYTTRYDSNLKTDATVTNATLNGTTLTLTVSAQTKTKNGLDSAKDYTITMEVASNFDVNSVLNKTLVGSVYKTESGYAVLESGSVSFK